MMQPAISFSRCAAALFGAFCIAYNLDIAAHELGHALAGTLLGPGFEKIFLNPFSHSYIYLNDVSSNPVFVFAGGALFGTLFGLTVWFLLLRAQSPFWLPLRLCGVLAPAINGIYLILDPLIDMGGDGGSLIHYGVSEGTVVWVGGGLLVLALVLGLYLQPALGIGPQDSFARRIGILWGGIMPYMALMVLYNKAFRSPDLTRIYLAVAGVAAGVLFIFAAIGWLFHTISDWPEDEGAQITWQQVWILLTLGAAVVIGILLFFG